MQRKPESDFKLKELDLSQQQSRKFNIKNRYSCKISRLSVLNSIANVRRLIRI